MKIDHFAWSTVVAGVVAFGAHLSSQGLSPTGAECTVSTLQAKAPKNTTITAAKVVEAAGTQPRYCQVDGHTATVADLSIFDPMKVKPRA